MRRRKGFTLLELLVVVIIIGILAAIALPRFMGQTEKAKMTEAMNAMISMREAEHLWHIEHDSYETNLRTLGFEDTTGGFTITGANDTILNGRHWNIYIGDTDKVIANRTGAPGGNFNLNIVTGDWGDAGYMYTPSEG